MTYKGYDFNFNKEYPQFSFISMIFSLQVISFTDPSTLYLDQWKDHMIY